MSQVAHKLAFITPTKDRPDQVIVVDGSSVPVREIVLGFGERLPVEYVPWEGKPLAAA